MSKYTRFDIVCITTDLESGKWKLGDDLHWFLGSLDSGLEIVIPKGFLFDGPSIPWFARSYLKTSNPRFWKASAIHDYLLEDKKFSRASAAAEFYNALMADGVKRFKARVMFGSVLLYHTLRKEY